MASSFDLIWDAARRVPAGHVITYGEIARRLGHPRWSRIVGCAMHAAPNDVPCHRVLDRFGNLCDAFQPMGKETHRMLLEMEGIEIGADGRVDLERFGWREEE